MARGRRKGALPGLAQREQQILEIVYQLGEATVSEVQARLEDELTAAGIHTVLRSIEKKGFLDHRAESGRHVFFPRIDHETAARSAFSRLVNTFFGGSVHDAMATLLDANSREISEEELESLRRRIELAREDDDAT